MCLELPVLVILESSVVKFVAMWGKNVLEIAGTILRLLWIENFAMVGLQQRGAVSYMIGPTEPPPPITARVCMRVQTHFLSCREEVGLAYQAMYYL